MKYIIYTTIISGNASFPYCGRVWQCTFDDIKKLVNDGIVEDCLDGMSFNTDEFDLNKIKNLLPGCIITFFDCDIEACAIALTPIRKNQMQSRIQKDWGGDQIIDEDEVFE